MDFAELDDTSFNVTWQDIQGALETIEDIVEMLIGVNNDDAGS